MWLARAELDQGQSCCKLCIEVAVCILRSLLQMTRVLSMEQQPNISLRVHAFGEA